MVRAMWKAIALRWITGTLLSRQWRNTWRRAMLKLFPGHMMWRSVVFQAKTVVLATGGMRPLNANRIGTTTGDGQMMAWRAGAELSGMEFCCQGNINCWERKGYAGGINMFQGYGARIVNVQGQRFMAQYNPVLGERSNLHTLAMAYTNEVLKGNGPIYIDLRDMDETTLTKFRTVIPLPMKLFDRLGIDVREQLIENSPAIEVPGTPSGAGGIRVDLNAGTKICGLYAAVA